jgi:hypothetical protein
MKAETTAFAPFQARPDRERRGFSRPAVLLRFRHFIEQGDWEWMILSQQKSLDRSCIGVLVVAALYFLPILAIILSR